jgi:hypothetical protein
MPDLANSSTTPRTALVIWQIVDGKPGHENQSRGLIQALRQIRSIELKTLSIHENSVSWIDTLKGTIPATRGWPKPDLIVGAGSRTHPAILAAGRQTRAKTIVLMSPPAILRSFFDLCIVPEHDHLRGQNVLTTQGALNTIQPSQTQSKSKGILLIGGPSKHHSWDATILLDQIQNLLSSNAEIHWKLTTSRRTPEATLTALRAIQSPRLDIIPAEETTPDWVPAALSQSATVWVTEDSVSMIYEALTSGAKVGLLKVPRANPKSRLLRGLDQLIEKKMVRYFDPSSAESEKSGERPSLNEAQRVASIIAKWV